MTKIHEENGGNELKKVTLSNQGKQILGVNPYEYYIYTSKEDENITLNELNSFTVFYFLGTSESSVYVDQLQRNIFKGDVVQSEGTSLTLSVKGGSVSFLISGTKEKHPTDKGVSYTSNKDIYRVSKPWGHELWLNGEHPCYALKEIFIKKGTKTSLQYHNQKRETNVLFEGEAKLHFKSNSQVENDDVTDKDISTSLLSPVCSIDVQPKILHRLEAVSDILLYETSTPNLDDVVRVLDDSNRLDGKISQEHQK